MINESHFSEAFAHLVAQAGWDCARKNDMSSIIERLIREGYVANPLALELLESFGGLTIPLPAAGISPYDHDIRFDPLRAASGESDRAEEWKDEIGVDLFPVGEEVSSGNIIWVGNDGRFYYGHGVGLYALGDSLKEAMDQLAFPAKEMVQVAT
jgi:hypothetical protein